jgi:putative mRNA 3-end processing factor
LSAQDGIESGSAGDVVVATSRGLFCPAGDFYIDPWSAVETALITHAHSDHARAGSKRYFAINDNLPLLHKRIGQISAESAAPLDLVGLAPGEKRAFNDVEVSFHPAGHILGSAQIRIDTGRSVWVVSGDYKRAADPTCAAFEPIRCDTFISEATFALPIYRWPAAAAVAREIYHWWQSNRRQGVASVLFCYALGKAQRVLAELMALTSEPVYAHGAVQALVDIYRARGIAMLPTQTIDRAKRGEFAQSLVIAPPGAAGSSWMRRFQPCATGFCSGWMRVRGQRRRRGYDRGFVLSDHADWPALLNTVHDSGAGRVLLTHGHADTLVRFLRERGCDAAALQTAYGAEE